MLRDFVPPFPYIAAVFPCVDLPLPCVGLLLAILSPPLFTFSSNVALSCPVSVLRLP